MPVPMTPSAAVSDFGGRRYDRFVPIFRKIRPLSSIIISETIFGGVDDTADQTALPILECLHLKIKISKHSIDVKCTHLSY
jgi:hypothetical protein